MCSDERPGMTARASVWEKPPKQNRVRRMLFAFQLCQGHNFPVCFVFVPARSVDKSSCQMLTTTVSVSQS